MWMAVNHRLKLMEPACNKKSSSQSKCFNHCWSPSPHSFKMPCTLCHTDWLTGCTLFAASRFLLYMAFQEHPENAVEIHFFRSSFLEEKELFEANKIHTFDQLVDEATGERKRIKGKHRTASDVFFVYEHQIKYNFKAMNAWYTPQHKRIIMEFFSVSTEHQIWSAFEI